MAIQTVKTGAAVNDGTGDDARTAFTKINQNFTDSANAASRLVGTASGNVMEVGAFGLGAKTDGLNPDNLDTVNTGFYYSSTAVDKLYANIMYIKQSDQGGFVILQSPMTANPVYQELFYKLKSNGIWGDTHKILSSKNTSIDGNGFIKAASPIVKLFADKIECNDEAELQPITFEKLGVGDYLIKGSTGFAQEGWYIEMPKDANGNVLVAVIYEQLDNNDISVKTYAKMFDPDTGDIVPNPARPRDIPATRWIDIRLQALPQPEITPTTDSTVTTNAE